MRTLSSKTSLEDFAMPFWCGMGMMIAFVFAVAEPTLAQTLAETGAALYRDRCSGCHGEELRAYSGGPAFDLRRLRPDEHDRFVDSVTSGKDNMPSWYGILKMEEIEAIWAYIRATVDRK
jgi:mono/diheme cytochrome c family protein